MNQKKRFRFELEIESTLEVEQVYETDYGSYRYVKQLVNEFFKDPEALRSIIYLNFRENYFDCFRYEMDSFLENPESEEKVILRVAQKCTPEVFQYFSDLCADDPGKEPGPDDSAEERIRWKNQESDWVFNQLRQQLCRLVTVHAVFSELPLVKENHPQNCTGKP
jgi:hypothetical protein